MKILISLFLATLLTQTFAKDSCNVSSFYHSITNQTQYKLKDALNRLLTRTHRSISYDDLHKAYRNTDIDLTFEGDGTILDMYSEIPNKKDPYNYKPGSKICGSYSREGSCYNREHLFPQGYFFKRRPMKTDIFHVYPTDGIVNNRRSSYPFGEVTMIHWQSRNGSKVGYSKSNGYTGYVFEPIDEFKGDIARAMLYFATRYQNQIPRFKYNDMTDGSVNQTYEKWFLKILLKWHKQDPVSDIEKRRNDIACQYQKNRNPFIDHPEWVKLIWE